MHLMLADPDLTGNLLAIGLALAVHLDSGITPWPTVADLSREVFGRDDAHQYAIRHALRDDARAYRTPLHHHRRCTAPMIRRSGECGKYATNQAVITDWVTGERHHILACSQPRHRDWWNATVTANRAQKPDLVPLPPANSGGVLARYFPEIDWPKLWLAIDPTWTPHPEPEPDTETEPGPPKLTLHLGEGRAARARRPTRHRLFAVPEPGTPPRLV
jgi:hypothetical protein